MAPALAEDGVLRYWTIAAVAAAALLALALDPFGGIVAGLAFAAGLIAVKRLEGAWDATAFGLSLAETLIIVGAGFTAGLAGRALRPRQERAIPDTTVGPAFGSLGLLDHHVAMTRLEEEVARALDHRRPLSLLMLDADVVDASLDPAARAAALRAVARILESRLHERDVPFAIGHDRLGAILPEVTATEGWHRVGEVVDALGDAAFVRRATGEQVALADAVEIHVGLAQLGPAVASADALLDAAVEGLRVQHQRPEEQPAA